MSAELRQEYNQVQQQIISLKKHAAELEWQYVKATAPSAEITIAALKTALAEGGFTDLDVLDELTHHITAGPVCTSFQYCGKHETQVMCNSIMYEWDGQRIVYVFANDNNWFNGHTINRELLIGQVYDFWYEDVIEQQDRNLHECIINNARIKDLAALMNPIPGRYKLLVAAFQRGYYDSPGEFLTEGIIPDVISFMP